MSGFQHDETCLGNWVDVKDIHSPSVTSDLVRRERCADHCRGRRSNERLPRKTIKSLRIKILTSNPFTLKILRTLFAKPVPVKAFRGVGEGGYLRNGEKFLVRRVPQERLKAVPVDIFFVQISTGGISISAAQAGQLLAHRESCFAILQYKSIASASCCFSMYSSSVCAT